MVQVPACDVLSQCHHARASQSRDVYDLLQAGKEQ